MTIIPATPGWIIEWDKGYGPPRDRIIAWEILDDPEVAGDAIPITTGGREHIGNTARILHLDDIDA